MLFSTRSIPCSNVPAQSASIAPAEIKGGEHDEQSVISEKIIMLYGTPLRGFSLLITRNLFVR